MLLEASPGSGSGWRRPTVAATARPANGPGCYNGAVNQYGQAAQGQVACEGAGSRDLWYGSANALFMGRSGSNRVFTSYETNNNPNQLMNTDMPLGVAARRRNHHRPAVLLRPMGGGRHVLVALRL